MTHAHVVVAKNIKNAMEHLNNHYFTSLKNIYFFEHKENFAIVHIFISKNIKRLHILYTFYLNSSDEDHLFRSIFKWSLHNSVDLVWANSNNAELIKKFERILPSRFK